MERRKICVALVLCAVCIGFCAVPAALAGEGGGSHYAGGNEDFMAGALPPPGLYFINYFLTYSSRTMRDGSGRNANPAGGFQADVVAEAARLLYVTKIKVLGGNVMWHVVPSGVYQHVSLGLPEASGGLQTQSKYGLGDLNFGLGVKWNRKTFHNLVAIDGWAPTGAYDKDDTSNIGRNYWAFNPVAAFTYLGDKDSPIPGFEVSAKFNYFINSTNTATGYTSGQEFSMDYLIGQHIGKWAFGANGHYFYQTTDDTYRNEPDSFDGYKGRKLSIGPAVQYAVGKGCITAKVLFDAYVRNKPEGTGIWLKFFYPF